MKVSVFAILLALIVSLGFWYFINSRETNLDILGNEYSQNQNVVPGSDNGQNKILENNQQKIMKATIKTNKGEITLEFLDKTAPNTVSNFIKLAESGFYNGVKFHRVIEGFMIQGGDPLTKDDNKKDFWGTGGPGYTFADEISSSNSNDYGTISMANAGPNTNGSQFFINVANNNFLDPKHTVFGKVIVGMDIVEGISKMQTDANDRPVDPVIIESISLE